MEEQRTKFKNPKRVISICLHQSTLDIIDQIAEKGKESRSVVIENVVIGWLSTLARIERKRQEELKKQGKENQNESNI